MEIKGEKFTPKGLDLYRVNTHNLLVKGEIFTATSKISVVSASRKNKIMPEFVENVEAKPSYSFYEGKIYMFNI